ncbi:MAG: hypothetical protein K2X74_13140 [Acetobacteraceae bacterium]|nr:hypothetical protein [Acetobacteraceae bacterium]
MGILSKDTEALLVRQASLRGESPDALVRRLLGGEASPPEPRRIDLEAIRAIQREVAALPLLDDRPIRVIRDELYED